MTSFHLLPAAERTWTPWKNGGGEMSDIAHSPSSAGLDNFNWRVGIARIDRDGPFSDFPDIDRQVMIVGGKGIRLDVEGLEPARITHKDMPFSFPGDRPITAKLIDGPSLALNVMTRRNRVHVRVGRVDGPAKFVVGDDAWTLLVWARGSADFVANGATAALARHDAALLEFQAEVAITPAPQSHGWVIELLPMK